MREFFRGWKRKSGVVTLLIACLFLAAWVRSITVHDAVIIGFRSNTFAVESRSHDLYGLALIAKNGRREKMIFIPRSALISDETMSRPSVIGPADSRWEIALGKFSIKGASGLIGFPSDLLPTPGQPIPFSNFLVQVPYWSIVVPLTLLSAYLLIRKQVVSGTQSEDKQPAKT